MVDRLGNSYASTLAQVRNTRLIVLQDSSPVSVSGETEPINVGDYIEGLIGIDITAVSGTSPTCDFKVETLIGNKWYDTGTTIAQQTSAGQVLAKLTNFGESIRLKYTLGGTSPVFTFAATFLGKS